jgi:FkbM family methyltransferase
MLDQTRKDKLCFERKAVSLADGPVPFYPFDLTKYNNMGSSSMLKIDFSKRNLSDPDYNKPNPQKEITVPGTRLDTYIKDKNINIDLLCMDLQGYELNALKSFGTRLNDVKYIITDSFKRDLLGNLYNLHLNNDYQRKINKKIFDVMTIKISPSLLFCSISTFNDDLYKKIELCYDYNVSLYKINNLKTKDKFNIGLDLTTILNRSKNIIKDILLNDQNFVARYSTSVDELFLHIPDFKHTGVLSGFLNEYRLCNISNKCALENNTCIRYKKTLTEYQSNILQSLIPINTSIDPKIRLSSYVYDNLIKFITLMFWPPHLIFE